MRTTWELGVCEKENGMYGVDQDVEEKRSWIRSVS